MYSAHLGEVYTSVKNAAVKKLTEFGQADKYKQAEMLGYATETVGAEVALSIAGTKGVDKLKNLGTASKLANAAEVIESTTDISKINKAVDTIQDFSKVGKINEGVQLVRNKLPKLFESYAREFEGEVRLRTFKAGDKIYRSPWVPDELAETPGAWYGTRHTVTKAGHESLYNVEKWSNPLDVSRTYEFTQDVTVYYGKVKDGTGYQVLIPEDVVPADVLKYLGETKLK